MKPTNIPHNFDINDIQWANFALMAETNKPDSDRIGRNEIHLARHLEDVTKTALRGAGIDKPTPISEAKQRI